MILEPVQEPGWASFFEQESNQPYFQQMKAWIQEQGEAGVCLCPEADKIFRAFRLCPFSETRVVILGQDPYPGQGMADGLAFSVPPSFPIPASLRHIFLELCEDLQLPYPLHGNLDTWARQGVLLLNTSLTVECGAPNSHRKIGWQCFTDALITWLSNHKERLFFLLWGKEAQRKLPLVDQQRHGVHVSAHPSPLSAHRGFRGSRPFSRANSWLQEQGLAPIQWDSLTPSSITS